MASSSPAMPVGAFVLAAEVIGGLRRNLRAVATLGDFLTAEQLQVLRRPSVVVDRRRSLTFVVPRRPQRRLS
jgi:hypothetical protein